MLNLVEQPVFDYGYPKPYPKFGLWCPLFDCFLMVGHDYNLLAEIQLLTCAKIVTIIIELSLPTEEFNIIDNEVCSQWSVAEVESINFTSIFKRITDTPKSSIVPKLLDNSKEVNQVQCWFIFVARWVNWCTDNASINRIQTFVDFTTNIQPQNQVKQQIYKILLTNDTIVVAQQQIDQII